MGALPFQTLTHFPCPASMSPSSMEKNAMPQNLHDRFPSLTVRRLPRRLLLQFLGFNPILLCVYPIIAAPMPEMKDPEVIRKLEGYHELPFSKTVSVVICDYNLGFEASRTFKLASGVRIQDIVEGEGSEVHEGDLVEVNYVCRRSNGYFVHSTVDQLSGESKPITLPLDENQIIKGLKEVLIGMRVGGKRRALIPPSLGYINENLKPIPEEFGPRRSLLSHANEPLVFEVQLLKVI